MVKRTISTLFCLALAATVLVLPAFAENDYGFDIEPSSRCVYFVCEDTGQVIYEKNAEEEITPASTTKIMSAALAMTLCEDLDNTIVTVPDGIWNEFDGIDVSCVPLTGGEQLSMRDLIYCMLIPSANEAASTVASYFGYDEFVRLMNEKAAELGCTHTHFTNPHGVFTDNHYTSAHDMYLITEWALSVPGFWDMTQLSSYILPATNKSEARELIATNKMQEPTSGYYTSYIKGIKTGTLNSGRYLVSAAEKNGMTYVLVALGSSMDTDTRIWGAGNSIFTDTRLIYDWAFNNLTLTSAINDITPVTEIKVHYASKKDSLLLYPSEDIYVVTNKNAKEEPTVEFVPTVPKDINAPISQGDVIGEAEVIYNGVSIGTVPLASRETVEFSRFAFIMENLSKILSSTTAKIIYAIILVVVVFYVWYMRVLVLRKRKKRKKR